MSTMPTYVTRLNNYFQQPPRSLSSLSFAESNAGPSDKTEWTVQCKVDGVVKGTGIAATKAAAKELAAKQTLQSLGQGS